MKVLITGASGRLAKYVIHELVNEYELILTSRHQPSEEFAHLHWRKADLTCFKDCQRVVKGVDLVQHLGAQPEPSDHPQMRAGFEAKGIPFDATFKTNLLGTYYLLQACVEEDVQTIVMTGSNCAFGHGFRISQTPFPFKYLPLDENHPSYTEDSYSFTKKAGEELLASYSRAYGIRTYLTRPAGIRTKFQRQQIAAEARPSKNWDPWLWAWVGSEDLAKAHRLIMERASELPIHDIYLVNADDTTALEPSLELVEHFQPELLPLVKKLSGNQSFFSCDKIKKQLNWQHHTSWRQYL